VTDITRRKPPNAGKGRPKGSLNKATIEVKSLAQQHGPEVIARLVALTRHRSGAVCVAACRELLDRGYGRPKQSHELAGPGGGPIPFVRHELTDEQLLAIAASGDT